MLSLAARDLEAKEPVKTSNSGYLRLLGVIYMLLEQNTLADQYFDKSIEVDQKKLVLSPSPDKKVKALWSISQTMQARGNTKAAIINIEQGINHALSPALRLKLEQQLLKLEQQL